MNKYTSRVYTTTHISGIPVAQVLKYRTVLRPHTIMSDVTSGCASPIRGLSIKGSVVGVTNGMTSSLCECQAIPNMFLIDY